MDGIKKYSAANFFASNKLLSLIPRSAINAWCAEALIRLEIFGIDFSSFSDNIKTYKKNL